MSGNGPIGNGDWGGGRRAPNRRQAAAGHPTGRPSTPRPLPVFAALDLGTNNCRLLVASPRDGGYGFRVLDAFSRIVRLGEGMRIVEVKIDREWTPAVYVKLLGLSGGRYEKEKLHSGVGSSATFPRSTVFVVKGQGNSRITSSLAVS